MKMPAAFDIRSDRLRIGAAVLAIVLCVVGLVVYLDHRRDQLPEDAAFRVDGHVVTIKDLEQRINVMEAMYGLKEPKDESKTETFQRDVAKAVAVQRILLREAEEHDIHIANKLAERALSGMIENSLGADRSQYTQFLSSSGITHQQVLDELKSILATNQLREKVVADVETPTSEEVRETYESRRSEMRSAERRHLANIVVGDRSTANVVVRQLRSGATFADVAASYSQDAATRDKGGDLGWHSSAELEEGFAVPAFKGKAGAVFGPVRTTHGWNVGTVIGVRPGKKLSFKAVRATLKQALLVKEQNDRWREWMAKALKDADVVYADDYRPDDPDGVPSDLGQAPSPANPGQPEQGESP